MDNIQPDRTRPEIEWSVSMTSTAISTDRFVIYGLEQTAVQNFLRAHGVDGQGAIETLESAYGSPSQVAVGRDGERAKLYWFLPSREPYFVGADFVDGRPLPRKIYTELSVAELGQGVSGVQPEIAHHIDWLLEQPELQSSRLFHGVGFRRGKVGAYSGIHIGVKPDWLGLLRRDAGLLYQELVYKLMSRLGFQKHWDEVHRAAFAPPMAWTCYVSVQVRPSGQVGLTVYSRSSPVVDLGKGLALVEPGEGGTYPRPAVVTCEHAELKNVSVRFRFHGPERSFVRRNGWFVDYGPTQGQHRQLASEELNLIEAIAQEACGQVSPGDPVGLIEFLRSRPGIQDVNVGPDLRKET